MNALHSKEYNFTYLTLHKKILKHARNSYGFVLIYNSTLLGEANKIKIKITT